MENSKEQIVDQSGLLELPKGETILFLNKELPMIAMLNEVTKPYLECFKDIKPNNPLLYSIKDEEFTTEQLKIFKETNDRAISRMKRSPLCNYFAGKPDETIATPRSLE